MDPSFPVTHEPIPADLTLAELEELKRFAAPVPIYEALVSA
jgi:hypothetical protein